jgi:glutamate racemase
VTQAPPLRLQATAPIGVFDSGAGGLSVLRHIRSQLPHEPLLYLADAGFAPYGDKPEQVVAERSLAIARFLLERGAKALVVACNTATVAAIKLLRQHYPHVPIVGVEPGLKPAAAATLTGKVGVMATESTLSGEKFLALRDLVSQTSAVKFLLQPCTGLADQVDAGELDTVATRAMLERFIVPLLRQDADTLVLGCTHYPFVRPAIERLLEQHAGGKAVTLVDTGDAVARQLARLLAGASLLHPADNASAPLTGFSTASPDELSAAFSGLLGLTPPVEAVILDAKIAKPN